MYARHRSPRNGYRSMGMGMSPEGSARGRGFYNSDYRSFNRGFGRGQAQPKSFQQPPPTLRKGDILMEAGRLAAEYLVSKGMLPSSVLSGKCQTVTFRSQDGDTMPFPSERGKSVLNHLGNSGSNVECGRKRHLDDYNSMGLGNYLKSKRRGSFISHGSDSRREYVKRGSWSGRSNMSPGLEGDDDSCSGHQEEQHLGENAADGLQKSGSGELAGKGEEGGDVGSRASSSSTGKRLLNVPDDEFSRKPGNSTEMDVETGELKDDAYKDKMEKQDDTESSSFVHCVEEGDTLSKSGNDLLALCKFVKVPTRTRSSLTYKGQKTDLVAENDDENTSNIKIQIGSDGVVEDGSAVDFSLNKSQDSMCINSEMSKTLLVQSVETVGAICSVSSVDQGKCVRSQSFPSSSFMLDTKRESVHELSDLHRSSSMVIERGEKQPMKDNNTMEGAKKLREWFPSLTTRGSERFGMSNLSEKKASTLEGTAPPIEKVTLACDQESSVSSYQFQKGSGQPSDEYAQEKQLFPGSYKICDLNLMEGSDLIETNHTDPSLIYPSIPKREATPVNIGLSMSTFSMANDYSRRQSDCKGIEVIDLDDDSVQEDKTIANLGRKTETMFTSVEGFPNNPQNAAQVLDVPDNYDGLTISQLLNTFPDCPPVPGDINPLQNEMVVHNGEGVLAYDDSIYMSLGEIPLSFLRGWEQPPPQEYGKPF